MNKTRFYAILGSTSYILYVFWKVLFSFGFELWRCGLLSVVALWLMDLRESGCFPFKWEKLETVQICRRIKYFLFFNEQNFNHITFYNWIFCIFPKKQQQNQQYLKISTQISIVADFFPKSSQVLRNQRIWERWVVVTWHEVWWVWRVREHFPFEVRCYISWLVFRWRYVHCFHSFTVGTHKCMSSLSSWFFILTRCYLPNSRTQEKKYTTELLDCPS